MEHSVLKAIKDEVWKGTTTKEVSIGNRKYVLKTLNDGEMVWRDKFIITSASFSFISGKKAPTVAVSLVSIDGILVREIFLTPEELIEAKGEKVLGQAEETVKSWLKLIGFGSADERFLVAQRIYEFMSELPTSVVDVLYQECLNLESEQVNVLNELLKKS